MALARPVAGCTVDGCDKPQKSRQMCGLHYGRLWRSINRPPRPAPPQGLALLMSKSTFESGPLVSECQVWNGTRLRQGYGHVGVAGKLVLAHRLAWTVRYGPIPDETPLVLHACDNPPCWRSDGPLEFYEINGVLRPMHGHLFLGTKLDNAVDRVSKGRCRAGIRLKSRTECAHGHAFDEMNTYVNADGHRSCRRCNRDRARARKARLRASGQDVVQVLNELAENPAV